uniref:C2H2-type domain-containing protein n=1 Tax=Graphocephala atropunctata TaxID=36148 RepID=A0A1B6LTP3_9HEMI
MDFKTRCPQCCKFFCCAAHRSDHQLKSHSDIYTKDRQDFLVKVFERKAKTLLLKSQKYQKKVKTKVQENPLVNFNQLEDKNKPATKRLYSEINKRILSTSVSVLSETRQILIPVRRLPTFRNTPNHETGQKHFFNEVRDDSPRDVEIGKTSTPISDLVEKTPVSGQRFLTTPSSSISIYQTPCYDVFTEVKPDELKNCHSRVKRGLGVMTPLQSIMSKSSRYGSDNEIGASPIIQLNNSRCRRVTFSFSSQVSSTNSPLEVLEEVEAHEEVHEQKMSVPLRLVNSCKDSQEFSEDCKEIKPFLEDSPIINEGGFFNCVTNIFCSAVHTIPSIGSWRLSQNEGRNQSKRSRSPETEVVGVKEVKSPIPKRPCYPCDLRLNPIKARKPIASS